MKSFSRLSLVVLLLIPHQLLSQTADNKKESSEASFLAKTARVILLAGPWILSGYALWQLHTLKKTLKEKEEKLYAHPLLNKIFSQQSTPVASTRPPAPATTTQTSSVANQNSPAMTPPSGAPVTKRSSLGSFVTQVASGATTPGEITPSPFHSPRPGSTGEFPSPRADQPAAPQSPHASDEEVLLAAPGDAGVVSYSDSDRETTAAPASSPSEATPLLPSVRNPEELD